MDYLYIKAVHIIFIVTWFAGLFYMPRLFIYNVEAQNKPEPEKTILSKQFGIMQKRLWFGITWPSAILTLIMGITVWMKSGFELSSSPWLQVKLLFVVLLYAYHLSLHLLYKQQQQGLFKYSSQKLRIWNEVATIFLVAIVMLVSVKTQLSFVWGLVGLLLLIILLMLSIFIYKQIRKN